MLRAIDHIVIVARDLARVSADFKEAGFTVTPGGEHVGGATHNALISFADGTYFELIAFKEPDRPQSHKWWSRLALGEGLTDYALGSTDLAADAEAIRRRGLELVGPVDGGRQRPDGVRLQWRTILLGRGASTSNEEAALPFVIEDVTPRERRVPGGAAAVHRLPAARVAGLTLVVSDLVKTGKHLEAVLNEKGVASSSRPATEGRAQKFPIGRQWLELLQPASPSTPAGEYLRRFGDGPYEVVLSAGGPGEPGSGTPVEGALHGTRIRLRTVAG